MPWAFTPVRKHFKLTLVLQESGCLIKTYQPGTRKREPEPKARRQ